MAAGLAAMIAYVHKDCENHAMLWKARLSAQPFQSTQWASCWKVPHGIQNHQMMMPRC